MKLKGWFDGACWPNPGGRASYGWVLSDEGNYYKEGSGVIGQGAIYSNNVAEYHGLYALLKFIKEEGHEDKEITIYGDSKLVVEQMNGNWRVKKGLYVDTFKLAYCMAQEFTKARILWIPREQNNLADYLSKKNLGFDVMNEAFKNTMKK